MGLLLFHTHKQLEVSPLVNEGMEWVVGEVYIQTNSNHKSLAIWQQNLIVTLLNTNKYVNESCYKNFQHVLTSQMADLPWNLPSQ
jgi:hypothetical protein